ncbi:quinone oxidoreductase PIG3-like [Sycon ciliatum]|uniref:quinone oxidoreductase PIG3-like n=1 Tax=Sycon ciliatum TaxID=27933 RepID=UPI0020ABF2D3|eukprot:scpid81024/ scgid35665/ Quinone oxidoreductase PIG3; Tumor protein p53-inducible protein 3; p53-induced gene 3 protein
MIGLLRKSSLSFSFANRASTRFFTMSLPSRMKYVAYDDQGTLSVEDDAPTPSPGAGQLLVKVSASGVNRLDLMQRKGTYPVPAGESKILGVEVSGTVVSVGENSSCSQFQPGDRVCALVGGGGYAEYCVTPVETTIKLNDEVSFVDGAAIPEAFLTAYGGLYFSCNLTQGESVMIHAAGSGVGTAAIQLAKSLSGSSAIFATAGSQEKLDLCTKLGATHTINYKEADFSDAVLATTGNRGVDVIMDFVGGSYWEKNLRSIALDGRIVSLGLLGGPKTAEPLNMGTVLRKRVTLTGSTLRSRSLPYKARLATEFQQNAMPLFAAGQVKPIVDSVFSIGEATAAHDRMSSNKNIGKIILTF